MTLFEEKIKNLITKLQGFEEFVDVVIDITMEEKFPDLVRSQLSEGINSQGNDIQIGYSNMWAEERFKRGLQTDFVDLNFSGRFYKSLETIEVGDEYFLDSNVPYASDIFDRYPNILGLTNENKSIIINTLRKEIIKSF